MENDIRTADCRVYTPLTEAVIDRENNVVQCTLIKAGWSKNGRYYSPETLERSVPVWEGVKAYANHPEGGGKPARSILDAFGVYENVRFAGDRVRGDLRLIGRLAEDLLPWIEEGTRGNHAMGLSINAVGKARKGEAAGRAGLIIEDIVSAHSIDMVDEPAAGGQFERLLMGGDPWTEGVLSALELEELREARPDIIKALQKEWKTPRDSKALEAARDKSEELESRLQQAQVMVEALQEQTRTLQSELLVARVNRMLDGTSLPDDWKLSLKEEILRTSPDEWQALIERETVKAQSVPHTRPVRVRGAGAPKPTPAVRTQESVASPLISDDYDFDQWRRDAHGH
jgi:hypothetical protein